MANIIFAERENACLRPPTLKMRQRLHSAPGKQKHPCCTHRTTLILVSVEICINIFLPPPAEKLLKSPMIAKNFNTPLPSGRKAFGAVNKKISTPAINLQEKKLLKSQVGLNHNSCNLKVMTSFGFTVDVYISCYV